MLVLRKDGYIGMVIDHNEFSNSIEDYETEEDNCPGCARDGFGTKLSRKIIYVEQTKRGPKISKHPIFALGLDPEKEYRQCRECGNIYDLMDLSNRPKSSAQEELDLAYRQGDFIPGPGPGIKHNKSERKVKKLKTIRNDSIDLNKADLSEPKVKGKVIKQIQRKIVKKIPVSPNT